MAMKTFLKWAEENKLELPDLQENGTRTGVKPQYPDGYTRSQYPDGYFPPTTATAFLDLKNSKNVKDKAPSNDAP